MAPSAHFCLSGCSTLFGFTEVGIRQKAKVGSGCSSPFGFTEVGIRQKAKVGSGCSSPFGFTAVGIFCLLPFTFCLLPFAFQGVASVRNPKSRIENPKSCVGPSAMPTGPRTRPSDWGSNTRFGPVEDRRNNRRLATFTCTLYVLQIWWLSPFTFPGDAAFHPERRPVRRLQRQSIFQPPALVHYGQHAISAKVDVSDRSPRVRTP